LLHTLQESNIESATKWHICFN